MPYTYVYPTRINWENEPSIATPLNATNLNKIDYAVYEHDRTIPTKADQSDLLQSLKTVVYDNTTGTFTFTWWNGTTSTVDLNIEKIPVSFSMDANGVITMTTEDGSTYTADVGSLIKTYTFTDSSKIDFTTTTDASGNKTVTASIVAGSITGTDLEPNYLANCQSAAASAASSASAADDSAEDSEAWAVGTRDGVPVPSTDPAYNNNSKYWAEHVPSTLAGLMDVNISGQTNGQVLEYNSALSAWTNATLNMPKYTSAISKVVGDTTVTFTDAAITSTSVLELFTQNASGTPMSYTNVSVSTGSVTFTFDALTEATDFKLRITNP